jgi:hypothetical protein
MKTVVLGLGAKRPGHVKVRLRFSTWDPIHLRSQVLATDFKVGAPFVEERSVLLPADQVYDRLSAYNDIFELLRRAGVVAQRDVLREYEIQPEDMTTLAYFEDDEI